MCWTDDSYSDILNRVLGCDEHAQAEWVVALASGAVPVCARDHPDDVGYREGNSYAIARAADGRFVCLLEWRDSTGHGCRCDGSISVHATLDEAVRLGLGDAEREDWPPPGVRPKDWE